MKKLIINHTYVMKHTAYPENRWYKGEYSKFANLGYLYDGLVSVAGKRFVVKEIMTHIFTKSYLVYFPDLNISIDYIGEYLEHQMADVINYNEMWDNLVLFVGPKD